MLLQITGIVTVLVTLIVSPFFAYLISSAKQLSDRLKDVENELNKTREQLNTSHHRSFKTRLKFNRVIVFIKLFKYNVAEVVRDSYMNEKPVTKNQLERLMDTREIDDIMKNDGKDED